ncbi:MAG: ATP-binding protein [Blautia sp.]|nr:ATP-binding protein [Blautia sp.]
MRKNNPFTISFGKTPARYINRVSQKNQIMEDWTSDLPSSQVYMITGIRGSGKTVLMTEICNSFKEDPSWIVINLNPDRDMLQSTAAKLYDVPGNKKIFSEAELNFSAFGLGVSAKNTVPVTDIENAIEQMLRQIAKHNKKVLIAVDEVSNTEHIRVFAATFQILIRENLPVFLLMTGLYDNIQNIQNVKTLTFLYRAPKVKLEPLNPAAVKAAYKEIFDISNDMAASMTRLTKGYSFAFQVLGYLYWQHGEGTLLQDVIPEFDQYLSEYVYEKVWSELSDLDQKIIILIAANDIKDISALHSLMEISPQQLYLYKKRLVSSGIIRETGRARIEIALPRFEDFVMLEVGM